MNRRNLISPAIIKHISQIASRGDKEFARAFLESQNFPSYLNLAIKSDIDSTDVTNTKRIAGRTIPFNGAIRVYQPKERYVSSPRRFLNSSSRS